MMNFLNMEYFMVLAEERNFSKAAARLFISQQSLSTHIRKLESEYGLPLFDRSNPLRLTEAGQQMFHSAKAILEEKRDLEKQMNDLRNFRMGDVVVGTPYARGALIMPRLIRVFREEFPQVRTHLLEGTTQKVTNALYNGETDLTLGFAPAEDEKVVSYPLYFETMKVVVPNRLLHECMPEELQRAQDVPLPLSAFADCPFVALHISTRIGEILKCGFEKDDVQPNIVAEAHNVFTMLALCCEGMGACVCPNSFLVMDNPLIDKKKLADTTSFSIQDNLGGSWITISHLKEKYLSRAARAFILVAKKHLTQEKMGSFPCGNEMGIGQSRIP